MVQTGGSTRAFPDLAPLSTPIVLHVAAYNDKLHTAQRQPASATLEEELARATERFRTSREELEQKIRAEREQVYTQMSPVVEQGALSTAWLLQALSTSHPVTRPTVHRWRYLNLISYEAHDRPEASQVAALLIASGVDPRPRGWLPGEAIDKEEALWWCWRQDGPDAPILPCPVPLPPNLPASALLWTPWPGAAWDMHWVSVGSGAVRWAQTKTVYGKLLWDIPLEDLRKWDPGLFPLSDGVLESAPEVLHSVAQLALIVLCQITLPLCLQKEEVGGSLPSSRREGEAQHSTVGRLFGSRKD